MGRTDRLIPSLLIFSSSFSLSSSRLNSSNLSRTFSSFSKSFSSHSSSPKLLPGSLPSSPRQLLLRGLFPSHKLLPSCHSCFNSSPGRTLKTCHTLFPSISFHPPEKL